MLHFDIIALNSYFCDSNCIRRLPNGFTNSKGYLDAYRRKPTKAANIYRTNSAVTYRPDLRFFVLHRVFRYTAGSFNMLPKFKANKRKTPLSGFKMS